MESFIKPEQTWILWAVLTGLAALSIYLEERYKWATKVTSSIIALSGALILSNLRIIPTESPVYDTVWGYIIPLSIPMLLFNCDMKKIWKSSGRLLGIFIIGAVGTVLGALIGYFALHKYVPGLGYVATIMTGSYIGGGVNFVALSDAFNAPSEIIASATVADNLIMVLYFFALLAIPSMPFFRKHFSHPLVDEVEGSKTTSSLSQSKNTNASKATEITLKDISLVIASSFIIVAISKECADLFSRIIPTGNVFLNILNSLFGNMYLILTTLTMLLATFKSEFFSSLIGAQEIGMFCMTIFNVSVCNLIIFL